MLYKKIHVLSAGGNTREQILSNVQVNEFMDGNVQCVMSIL